MFNNEIPLLIPLKIAQRKDIRNLTKLIYGYLLRNQYHNENICILMADIAKDLKRSRQQISQSITELKNKHLIKITKTGRANHYELL